MSFPNPCPVCGADDEHAEQMKQTLAAAAKYPVATVCPHPDQPGHGTGCCCAGRSTPLTINLPPGLYAHMCGVCGDLTSRCLDAGERCPRPASQEARRANPSWPFGPIVMGAGPRHDRTGTKYAKAVIGDKRGRYADLEVMTWTGCNGQRCARDCGPGHHVRLWVPCRFAVGDGHWITLTDEEITALRDALGALP